VNESLKKLRDVNPEEMGDFLLGKIVVWLTDEGVPETQYNTHPIHETLHYQLRKWYAEIAQEDLLKCDHHIDFLEVIQHNNSMFIQCSKCALICPIHHTDNWAELPDE